jgi:hypothetical protein
MPSNRPRPGRTVRSVLCFAAGSVLLAHRAPAADRHWYGGLDNGDWQTPAHWKEGVVPLSSDNAIVDYPNRTVTLSKGVLIQNFSMSGGVGPGYNDVGLSTSGQRLDVAGAAYVNHMAVQVTAGSVFTARPSRSATPTASSPDCSWPAGPPASAPRRSVRSAA